MYSPCSLLFSAGIARLWKKQTTCGNPNGWKKLLFLTSGGPLSALTCCVNVRLLSGDKKIIAVNLFSKLGWELGLYYASYDDFHLDILAPNCTVGGENESSNLCVCLLWNYHIKRDVLTWMQLLLRSIYLGGRSWEWRHTRVDGVPVTTSLGQLFVYN